MELDFKVNKKKLKAWLFYIGIIVLGIALDQFTKFLAVRFLKERASIKILGNFVKLTYAENRGMAFGMMENSRWVFMSVSTVAIILMIGYLFFVKNQPTLYKIAIAIVASGGIGNMIDRAALGYVVDFVNVEYFAIFNGADSLVCIGAGLLILAMSIDIAKEAKAAKAEKQKKAESETKE